MTGPRERTHSERRLTELGTANWNNRGFDNHVKRPAGVSSACLKRSSTKRMDAIQHPKQHRAGNSSAGMDTCLKYPKQCLVSNEHVYDGHALRHNLDTRASPFDPRLKAAGVEAEKTVQYNNYAALSDPERDGPEGGRPPCWLMGQQTKKRVTCPFAVHRDPISHDAVVPHDRGHRPLRRMGPPGDEGSTYQNAAAKLNWNLHHQQQNTGPLSHVGFRPEDWRTIGKREFISPHGEVLYNVGGHEDLRPPCTKEYTKADRPPCLLTQYENDSRQLVPFERDRPMKKKEMHVCSQSPEMLEAMFGDLYRDDSPISPSHMVNVYRRSRSPSAESGREHRTPRRRPASAPSPMKRPLSAREFLSSRCENTVDDTGITRLSGPISGSHTSATSSFPAAAENLSYRRDARSLQSVSSDNLCFRQERCSDGPGSVVSSSRDSARAPRRSKSVERAIGSQRRDRYKSGSLVTDSSAGPICARMHQRSARLLKT